MASGTDALLERTIATMLKVPLLFFLTLAITFPSLYIFNALIGSRLSASTVLQRNPRHRYLLRTWIVLYVFIGIQLDPTTVSWATFGCPLRGQAAVIG